VCVCVLVYVCMCACGVCADTCNRSSVAVWDGTKVHVIANEVLSLASISFLSFVQYISCSFSWAISQLFCRGCVGAWMGAEVRM